MTTATCKLYSRVFWTFEPNFIKIDLFHFELYRLKVGAFFGTQCRYLIDIDIDRLCSLYFRCSVECIHSLSMVCSGVHSFTLYGVQWSAFIHSMVFSGVHSFTLYGVQWSAFIHSLWCAVEWIHSLSMVCSGVDSFTLYGVQWSAFIHSLWCAVEWCYVVGCHWLPSRDRSLT